MAGLTLKKVSKSYGTVTVLPAIDLDITSGEFVVFVGPSGCGKSTLLRCIAGLEEITGGELLIDGERMNEVEPSRRGIAMVFQSYALYPHMTVFENMAFGLRISGMPRGEIDIRIRRTAEVLQLTPYLQRLPRALSGGQRQRVAIGRAIVRDPRIFLFDEPLSNLDAALRVAMRLELGELKRSMPGVTMIYVTHDQIEAMTLADRIVVMNAGRIEQVGSPLELYRRPANLFVARFIGSPAMNVLPVAAVTDGTLRLESGGSIAVPPEFALAGQDGLQLGVRPEDLRRSESIEPLISGKIDAIEHLGEMQMVYVTWNGQRIIAKLPGTLALTPGSVVNLDANPDALHLFGSGGSSLRREKLSSVGQASA